MIIMPTYSWPLITLAAVLLGDALLSIRPLPFIRQCLTGVQLPERWWWVLIVAKVLAASGLIAGLWVAGIAAAACTGVIAYFGCAITAHIRARAFGLAFWGNCLVMMALAIATPLLAFR